MRPARLLAAASAVATLALTAHAGVIKTDIPGDGTEHQLVHIDDPVSQGKFDGTWMYVNRDARFAVWIRTTKGTPQIRLQYQSLASPEAFESDWDGKAVYFMAANPVTFELKVGEGTADRITGKWSWVLTVGDAMRREVADLVIYRSGYGRNLVMDFQNYEKTITAVGKNKILQAPMVWNWLKVSDRELLWDELPF